jgi:integrase
MTARKEVIWFAERMEGKLLENDHKGHWSNCTNAYLKKRLQEEVDELQKAIAILDTEEVTAPRFTPKHETLWRVIFRPVNRWGRVVQYGEQQRLWPQYVEKIVKRLMTNAGLDHKGYGAHSLRAGFITQAALNGHTESEIMRYSGHSNTKIVQRYIRIANLDKRNTTEDMGL